MNHSFINIKAALGLGYLRKRQINVIRIESDNFKVCEPKIIRAQKHVVSEKTCVVHVPKRGKIRITELK